MTHPIVSVTTADKLTLYGLLLAAPGKKAVLINVHGTASNFYENDFLGVVAEKLSRQGVSVLSTNNRGAHVLECYTKERYQPTGAAIDRFEDCLLDIDAWIAFALKQGFRHIYLSGHSLGTEKVVYYMVKGKYRKLVRAVILFAPADSYGAQLKFEQRRGLKLMVEAKRLIAQRRGRQLLSPYWKAYSGVLPLTAQAYYGLFRKGSAMSKTFPFWSGKLPLYRLINVPILAVIGDQHEFTVIPIKQALKLMERENPNTEAHQLKHCNHDFEGKEPQLAAIVSKFVTRVSRE